MYQAEFGITYNEFDTSLPAKDFMHKYITPYMAVIKECNSVLDCYKNYPLAIDRSTKITGIEFLSILSDGSYLGISNSALAGKIFFFDINGAKGPNYSGRDIFYFYLINASTMTVDAKDCNPTMLTLQSGLYPGGYGACYVPFTRYKRSELLDTSVVHRSCNKHTTYISSGEPFDACAAVIMIDGWEIKDDYPW